MRIGAVAGQSAVPVKTLRYYETLGLLDPPERTGGGYRDYPPGIFDRLAFIRAAQAVGLTLAEIREIIAFRERGETPCAHVLAVIDQRHAQLGHRIKELQRLRRELRALAERGRRLDPADCTDTPVCQIISATTSTPTRATTRPPGRKPGDVRAVP